MAQVTTAFTYYTQFFTSIVSFNNLAICWQ